MKNELLYHKTKWLAGFVIAATITSCNTAKQSTSGPLVIDRQGSFAAGGALTTQPGIFDPIKHGAYQPVDPPTEGQTLHGDHAYVFYQVPANRRKLPLVFWHGHGQFTKTWETTPDGREGFQTLFLRRRFPVYLLDQPRRGHGGRSTEPINLIPTPDDQLWFGIFRFGVWPQFYPGVQFSNNPGALNQFFRQGAPNIGPYNADVNIRAVSAIFDSIGAGILVTHSQSGGPGWRTALRNPNVKAIVAYEPGGDYLFPEGETPAAIVLRGRTIVPPTVPVQEFKKLTKIPIVIYYGDNIPDSPSENPGQEQWRVFLQVARQWRDVVNKYGGDVTLVHLPEIGIHGNTHFPFADLNNVQIADLLSTWLREKKLD
ncbi:alpha/beta hydrolase [Paraflavitalea pollutisoli]|uniref:alpha/beta hydrolase n=1 Tax=Paraflavitalea pollutisoli TaxID=3034143 RepID=UPI0023EE2500|nr:alpha/beta fold hydrolase [Paraflavitalea sp. H1-2-19X]